MRKSKNFKLSTNNSSIQKFRFRNRFYRSSYNSIVRLRTKRLPRIFFPRWRLKRVKKALVARKSFIKFTRVRSALSNTSWQLSKDNNFLRRETILKFLAWKFNILKSLLVKNLSFYRSSLTSHYGSLLQTYFYLNLRVDILVSRWLSPLSLKSVHGLVSLGWVCVNGINVFNPAYSLQPSDRIQSLIWNRFLVKSRRYMKTELTANNYVRRFGLRYDLTPLKYLKSNFKQNMKTWNSRLSFSRLDLRSSSFSGLYHTFLLKSKSYRTTPVFVSTRRKLKLVSSKGLLRKDLKPKVMSLLSTVKVRGGLAKVFYAQMRLLNKYTASVVHEASLTSNRIKLLKSKTLLKFMFYSLYFKNRRIKARGKNSENYRPLGKYKQTYLIKNNPRFVFSFNYFVKAVPTSFDFVAGTLLSPSFVWKDPIFTLALDVHSFYFNKGLKRVL